MFELLDDDEDVLLNDLRNRRCACGSPAVEAFRRLDAPGAARVYLCVTHRRRIGGGPARR